MNATTKKPTAPRQKILSLVAFNQHRLLVRVEKDHDQRLLRLAGGLGILATNLTVPGRESSLPDQLANLAAWCVGWVEVIGTRADVITLIHQERDRQNALVAEGDIPWNCSTIKVNPASKLCVLVEEIGEVAEAVLMLHDGFTVMRREHLVTELVQVAAVCVGWMEALEAPAKKEGK